MMLGKICKTFVKKLYNGEIAARRMYEIFLLSLALVALTNDEMIFIIYFEYGRRN
jgi:hypothetical protein